MVPTFLVTALLTVVLDPGLPNFFGIDVEKAKVQDHMYNNNIIINECKLALIHSITLSQVSMIFTPSSPPRISSKY